MSNARPKRNEKPTKDQPKTWTENSGSSQGPQSRGIAVKNAIVEIRNKEKGEQANDDKDEMENEKDSLPEAAKPSKGSQDSCEERK
ncbi:hypothetical protein ccbrp13_16440 [Ktedonobacteria bacterium brp13]|nr:hypothetical protein ccbrp13_16440 [Ktedonobacteria bacterium brp13]